jgi:hypothetical protein
MGGVSQAGFAQFVSRLHCHTYQAPFAEADDDMNSTDAPVAFLSTLMEKRRGTVIGPHHLLKNRFAAETSRLALSINSMVCPCLSRPVEILTRLPDLDISLIDQEDAPVIFSLRRQVCRRRR